MGVGFGRSCGVRRGTPAGLLLAVAGALVLALAWASPAHAQGLARVVVPMTLATSGTDVPVDATFSFRIEPLDEGEALLPQRELVTTAAGDFSFVLAGDVEEPGEHRYRVTQVGDDRDGWELDRRAVEVTVTVGWAGDAAGGTLEALDVSLARYGADGTKLDDTGFHNARAPRRQASAPVPVTGDVAPSPRAALLVGCLALALALALRARCRLGL